MLFKIEENGTVLRPAAFLDMEAEGRLEKDLEDLMARHFLGVLYEEGALLPISQSRPRQGEADIYALDRDGDLNVFELKRGLASAGAIEQVMRYGQVAAGWSYYELERRWRNYANMPGAPELALEHQAVFELAEPLPRTSINRRQRMWVVGHAAERSLADAVEYWKAKGVPVDFLPYRIYRLQGEHYFEFFARPFDHHANPGLVKGVLFDTNRTYDENAFQRMLELDRISAFGARQDAVRVLNKGDYVFYSHRRMGVMAAAEVLDGRPRSDDADERHLPVRFLAPKPEDLETAPALSFQDVEAITGRRFFWARTNKVPYLTRVESETLLEALRRKLP